MEKVTEKTAAQKPLDQFQWLSVSTDMRSQGRFTKPAPAPREEKGQRGLVQSFVAHRVARLRDGLVR